jgi:hypothetical protein
VKDVAASLETMLMKAVIGVGIEDGVVCIVLQDGTEVYLEGVTLRHRGPS